MPEKRTPSCRATGASAPRALFPEALAGLEADASGMVHATLRLAMLTGWAPSASQPRPLAPGTARHSLAQALTGSPIETDRARNQRARDA